MFPIICNSPSWNPFLSFISLNTICKQISTHIWMCVCVCVCTKCLSFNYIIKLKEEPCLSWSPLHIQHFVQHLAHGGHFKRSAELIKVPIFKQHYILSWKSLLQWFSFYFPRFKRTFLEGKDFKHEYVLVFPRQLTFELDIIKKNF